MPGFQKDLQYYKFCLYGFLKNLRFFEPFLMLFFLEKGLNFTQIGFLYAFRQIGTGLLEIPSGAVSDALGRRRTMIWSFGMYIISFLVFFCSNHFLMLVAAMAFFSLGDAFRTGTHKAMILDYLKIRGWKNQKVHYYGHTRSWSQMGSALSSLLAAGIVFFTGNYTLIFLFSVIPYLLDLILISTYPKVLDGQMVRLNSKMLGGNFRRVSRDFISSFKDPRLLRATFNYSVYTGYYKAVRDYLQPVIEGFALSIPLWLHLAGEKRSAVLVGVVYFCIYLLTSFVSRRSGRIADCFPSYVRPLNISMTLGFAIGLLSGWAYSMDWVWISVLLFVGIYLFENMRKPMGVAYVAETLDKEIMATVLSASSQLTHLLGAAISLFVGWMADTLGIGLALAVVSAILLLGSPFYRAHIKN